MSRLKNTKIYRTAIHSTEHVFSLILILFYFIILMHSVYIRLFSHIGDLMFILLDSPVSKMMLQVGVQREQY